MRVRSGVVRAGGVDLGENRERFPSDRLRSGLVDHRPQRVARAIELSGGERDASRQNARKLLAVVFLAFFFRLESLGIQAPRSFEVAPLHRQLGEIAERVAAA